MASSVLHTLARSAMSPIARQYADSVKILLIILKLALLDNPDNEFRLSVISHQRF
jgi:hypothetical protein